MSASDRFTPSSALPTASDRFAIAPSPPNAAPVKPDPFASRMAVDREFPSQSSRSHASSSDRYHGHRSSDYNSSRRRSSRSRSRSPFHRHFRSTDQYNHNRSRSRSRSRSPRRPRGHSPLKRSSGVSRRPTSRSRSPFSRSRSRSRSPNRSYDRGRDRDHDRGRERSHRRSRSRSRSPPGDRRVSLNSSDPDPYWFFDSKPAPSLVSPATATAAASGANSGGDESSPDATSLAKEAAVARASDASIRSLCLTLARAHARSHADNYQIFLSQLHPRTEERDLADLLSLLQVPFAIKLSRDPRSGRSRGVAFASFPSTGAVETALRLNGQLVFGLPLSVERTTSLPVARPTTSATTTAATGASGASSTQASASATTAPASATAGAGAGKDKVWLTITGLPPMISVPDVRRRLLTPHLRALAGEILTARTEPGAATAWVCFENEAGAPVVVQEGVAAVDTASAVASAAARIIKEAVEEGKVEGVPADGQVKVQLGKVFPDSVLRRLHFDPAAKESVPLAVWPHPKLFGSDDEAPTTVDEAENERKEETPAHAALPVNE